MRWSNSENACLPAPKSSPQKIAYTRSLLSDVFAQLQRGMILKPSKVLWCRFLFAILGVDPAQYLAKYKRQLRVFDHTTNQLRQLRLRTSCIVSEHKTKEAQGQGLSNINHSLFVCFFNVVSGLLNHFPLLTMVYRQACTKRKRCRTSGARGKIPRALIYILVSNLLSLENT